MNHHPRSLAASLLGFALTVLAASMALNWAACLLLEVWPVLLVAAVVALVLAGAFSYWRRRDRW